jgi:hypothetical protein
MLWSSIPEKPPDGSLIIAKKSIARPFFFFLLGFQRVTHSPCSPIARVLCTLVEYGRLILSSPHS